MYVYISRLVRNNIIPQDDWYEFDDSELDLPPPPSNLLNPPMWNSKYPTGGCGKWQKTYTKFHKGIYSIALAKINHVLLDDKIYA